MKNALKKIDDLVFNKQFEEALAGLEQLIDYVENLNDKKYDKQLAHLYYYKASILNLLNKFDEALEASNRSCKLDSTNVKHFCLRKSIHECLGNKEAAMHDQIKVFEKMPAIIQGREKEFENTMKYMQELGKNYENGEFTKEELFEHVRDFYNNRKNEEVENMDEFDYKNLVETLVGQAKSILENDDTFFETDVEYISSTMEKFTLIAGEAADNDNNFNDEQKCWLTQVVAEWIYYKACDIVRTNIPEKYHDNIFQKFAYVVYQTITDGWKNGVEEQTILNNVEDNIVETNKNILKELLNLKFIDQECYEFALSLSRIDELYGTEQTNDESWQEKYEELEIKYNDLSEKYGESQELIKRLSSMIDPNSLYANLGVDILSIHVGEGLIPIADPEQGGDLLEKKIALDESLKNSLGYILPPARYLDSPKLCYNEYSILIRDNSVASGFVCPNKLMVIASQWELLGEELPENTIVGIDPTSCGMSYWIDEEIASKYSDITAVTPTNVILHHLEKIVIKYVDELLTIQDVYKYIELAKSVEHYEEVIHKILENIDVEDIRRVFVNLIREEISIKDYLFIFEKLADYSRFEKNPDILSELIRQDLYNQISNNYVDENNVVYAIEFSDEYKDVLEKNICKTPYKIFLNMECEALDFLPNDVAEALLEASKKVENDIIVVCNSSIRLPLYRFLVEYIPSIKIVSKKELATYVKVEIVEKINYNSVN